MKKQQQKTIERMPAKQTYIFQINIQLFFSLMSIYIKKSPSQKPIVLENIADYKILDLNDYAHFPAFLLKSNRLMNIYIQKIKVRYQCQQIPKNTAYSNPIGQDSNLVL